MVDSMNNLTIEADPIVLTAIVAVLMLGCFIIGFCLGWRDHAKQMDKAMDKLGWEKPHDEEG